MKQHTLTRFFLLNYLSLLVFLLAGVWAANSYSAAKVNEVLSWVSDDRIMNAYAVYETQGAEAYFAALKEIRDYAVDYFLILSPNGTLLDQYGSAYTPGHQFPESDANGLINDPDTYAFYPGETQDIVIVKLVGSEMRSRINRVMIRAWGTYSLGVVLMLFLMTRITARRVLRPVERLIHAVREVGGGRYDIQADFEARHELGQLKEALLAMSGKIQEENRLKAVSEEDRRQLVLNISHDLKTPLTNIRGYAETALSRWGAGDEALANHLQIILNNSIRADNLLRNLFELSRIENARFAPRLTLQDAGETVRVLLSRYVPQFEAAGIQYDIEIPSEPLPARIDEALIGRALSNLLDNSIRYLGGVKEPAITVTVAQPDPSQLRITVSDNGPGIAPELREQVFKPFVTGDSSRSRMVDGTGLGLAITRAIIEKHRGRIAIMASSSPGVGFEILLPAEEAPRSQES